MASHFEFWTPFCIIVIFSYLLKYLIFSLFPKKSLSPIIKLSIIQLPSPFSFEHLFQGTYNLTICLQNIFLVTDYIGSLWISYTVSCWSFCWSRSSWNQSPMYIKQIIFTVFFKEIFTGSSINTFQGTSCSFIVALFKFKTVKAFWKLTLRKLIQFKILILPLKTWKVLTFFSNKNSK